MLTIDLEDIVKVYSPFSSVDEKFKYIHQHEDSSTDLVFRIRNNTRRYISLFSEVVDSIMPLPTKDISEHDEVIDVILHQRRERNEQTEGTQAGFPNHLLRR